MVYRKRSFNQAQYGLNEVVCFVLNKHGEKRVLVFVGQREITWQITLTCASALINRTWTTNATEF